MAFIDVIGPIIDVLVIAGIYIYWKFVPNNGNTFLRLLSAERQLKDLKAKFETESANVYDLIDSHMKPIAQRNRMRVLRERKKQEEEDEPQTGFLGADGKVIKP